MPIKSHQDVINDLLNEDQRIQTKRFKVELEKLVNRLEPDVGDEIEIIRDYIAIVPDAYLIDNDRHAVTIYEVIDTHKIDKSKKHRLAWAWMAIDHFYIECSLVICDVYGGRNIIDLKEWLKEVVESDDYPKGWPQAYRRKNTPAKEASSQSPADSSDNTIEF